jgi:flagellar biosynthesis/type III secretory pathway M-ring protein FliF/YscJ
MTFELVPGDLYQEYMWNWNEAEELNRKQEGVGLDSRMFMLSMGFPFYAFAISIVLLVVAIVLTCIVIAQRRWDDRAVQKEGGEEDNQEKSLEDKKEGEKEEKKEKEEKSLEEKTESFRNDLLWNFFLMFFYEATLEICISLILGF